MAFDFDTSAVWNNFIDGDNTKTLTLTVANAAGRAAFAIVWAGSGGHAGNSMTCGVNTMTASAVLDSINTDPKWRVFWIQGDANIPTGSVDFKLSASSQIIARMLVCVVNGLTDPTPIIGPTVFGDASPPAIDPSFSVGGDASWTGDVAFGIGLASTSNFHTITAGANTTLDISGAPANPQAFAGHRSGGNVSVNFVSSNTDEFVMAAWSLEDGSAAASAPIQAISQHRRRMEG